MRNLTMKCKIVLLLALLLAAASSSAALLTYVDRIDEAAGSPELDFYSFSVVEAGEVTFTVEGAGVGFDAGNGVSSLDTFFILAIDDGERNEGDILGSNDDGGTDIDSLFTIFLDIGDYIAGVSSCCISPSEFVSGINSSINYDSGLVGDTPDYRFTIDGSVAVDVEPPVSASSPTVFALFGLALVALGFRNARK